MNDTIPPPTLSENDHAFCLSLIESYPDKGWEHEEQLSILADALRMIRSIATKYTDATRVELNFDELESEGRLKLIRRVQGSERSKNIWQQFAVPDVGATGARHGRGALFRHLKACLNNHIKGIVHRNCYTAKRTGRKSPMKVDKLPKLPHRLYVPGSKLHAPGSMVMLGSDTFRNVDKLGTETWVNVTGYDRSFRPEISLDHEDVRRVIERFASNTEDPSTSMDLEDIGQLLNPIEFLVMKQLTNPNPHALALATIDSYYDRRLGEQVNIKITQEHQADGLGIDRTLFKEIVTELKIKVKKYMQPTADGGHRNAAVTTLETIFNIQIPLAMPAAIVRRLLTLVARDNVQKVTPAVDDLLKLVGAKAPKVDANGGMACFGVLFQRNHRTCCACGLRQACETEAANYELGPIALSPKLFGTQALVRTQALSSELPESSEVATQTTVADEETDDVVTVPLAPLTQSDEVVKNYLDANFAAAEFKGQHYYRHKVRPKSKDGKSKITYIFWLGQKGGKMALRFCPPCNPRIASQLDKRERNNLYAPAAMPAETLIKLIIAHADDRFKAIEAELRKK